jgi:hypothetical protein
MPNGKIGDHPITDLLIHGKHPFPSDIEEMIRKLHAIDPHILHTLELEPLIGSKERTLRQGVNG